jgi:hypothetical protein
MKRLVAVLFCLSAFCAAPLLAQDSSSQGDQNAQTTSSTPAHPAPAYNPRIPARFEFSGGYVYRPFSPTANQTLKMNGGYASADYNIFTWLGVSGEGLGVVRKQGEANLGTSQTLSIFTGLIGPQFYPMRHRKVTLFGHALIGEGYYNLWAPAFGGFPAKRTTSTGFAYEVGAGLDVRIKAHWAIRLIEGDFGETSFSVGDPKQEGYRITAGVTYLRGQK